MNQATTESAGPRGASGVVAAWLERVIVASLFLFAASVPHSIAVAEGAWVLGVLAWAARFVLKPRPILRRTSVDYALLAFFVLTFVSSLCSYEPDTSIGKLRAASLFTVAYLAAENVRSRRVLRALVITLVVSCMANVAYTFAVYARGRGVKIVALAADSPLATGGLRAGDTVLGVDRVRVESPADIARGMAAAQAGRELMMRWPAGEPACWADERAACVRGVRAGDTVFGVDRVRVESPADIARGIAASQAGRELMMRWPAGEPACWADERAACVRAVRAEVPLAINVERGKFLSGETEEARLGLSRWSRGRDERATGFYGQYQTYSEVLQLIGSLALGLLVALAFERRRADGPRAEASNVDEPHTDEPRTDKPHAEASNVDASHTDEPRTDGSHTGEPHGGARASRWRRKVVLLCVAVSGIGCALLLTVTRASWAAFFVSALVVVLAGTGSRRALVALVLAACVVAPVALFVLREKRRVGLVDQRDLSTTWRETVWREAVTVLVGKPRHLLVGVGMDTLKRRWREWGMFEGGRLPWGHLHSTPLQIAFERGLPALAAWLALLALYWRAMWRLARRARGLDWVERGLALGALGGAVGFFVSGLVHYNLGDSEVALNFYFIMGLGLALEVMTRGARVPPESATRRELGGFGNA